jgi:hypothetical protein
MGTDKALAVVHTRGRRGGVGAEGHTSRQYFLVPHDRQEQPASELLCRQQYNAGWTAEDAQAASLLPHHLEVEVGTPGVLGVTTLRQSCVDPQLSNGLQQQQKQH